MSGILKFKEIIISCFLFLAIHSPILAETPKFTMSFYSTPDKSPTVSLVLKIYTEVFRRLDMVFDYKFMPAKRASIAANAGEVDGEPARRFDHNKYYPNLLRVEESIFSLTFSAFSGSDKIRLNGWESLKGTDYRVDYLRGSTTVTSQLGSYLKPKNFVSLNDRSQAFQRLQSGRADLYIDGEIDILALLKTKEYKDIHIYKAGVMGENPVYAFVNKKHKDLIPKLAAIIKKMKEEGLIEKYMAEVIGQ